MIHATIEQIFTHERPGSVFELGCAGGPFLQQVQEKFGDIKVGGIDITKSDLFSAKQKFPKYEDNFLLHNLVETPWPIKGDSYDIVFTVGVLMYIFEPEKVISEALRIGKKLIIAEFHNRDLDEYGGLTKITHGETVQGTGITRNYIKLLEKMGLKYEIKHYEPPYKSIIVCQK